MTDTEKIKSFAAKVRAALLLEKHGIADKLKGGNWRSWKSLGGGSKFFSALKAGGAHGLLYTRKAERTGRGGKVEEYAASPELARLLQPEMRLAAVLSNAKAYEVLCFLRARGEVSSLTLFAETGNWPGSIVNLSKKMPGVIEFAAGKNGNQSRYCITPAGAAWLAAVERDAGVKG